MEEEYRRIIGGNPGQLAKEGEEVIHGVWVDMSIAQKRLGVAMAHQRSHADQRIAHFQAPGGEGVPERVRV